MALSNLTKVQTLGIGSNIEVVGVITTGQFKSGTSNLHSTGVKLTNLNVSGIATIGGNLSIGGTLTYQDVTNIDSIGIITARAGVNVSGGQLDVGSNIKLGNAGVITATSFVGSGANLTNLPSQVTINNASANRVFTSDGGTTLNGEANFTYDGDVATITRSANSAGGLSISNTNNSQASAHARLELSAGDNSSAIMRMECNGHANELIADGSGNFRIDDNGTERVRITSAGNFGVGDYSSTNLTHAFQALRTSGNTYVSSKNTGGNALFYAEASSGNTAKLELMQAGVGNFTLEVGSANALMFKDDGTEKVRIDNNGNLCVGITGGSAKFHTKGDQSGGLIKCDAAEGTVRFFLTGNDTSACELNMYNEAGVQSTIIKAGASNKSTDIQTAQAGGRHRVYVTPNSGRTYRTSIFRAFQVNEYGELDQHRSSEGWTTGYYETNNGGIRYHHRHAYTGASSANVNLIRVRRHYWGAGHYKISVKNTYYGGSWESTFWLNGHAANGNTSAFSISHNNTNSGNSGWIQKTATSHSAPGNNYSGWTDVFISIPAYHYFDIRIEASQMASYSYDINNIGNDGYALHPFS